MTKTLIIDDDPDFVLVTRAILESSGYKIVEAQDGSQALDLMRQEEPDLVLLDVMMTTTLEGVEVSKVIASDPDLEKTPVVMISSIATSEHAPEFPDDEQIPIAAWISKPVQPQVLLKTIQRILE